MYSCHLFLISSVSVRSIPFLSFIKPIFAWNVPLASLIFEEISSVFHSVVFLYFFALIAEEGFLISSCYSLELWIQMFISFLFSFAFRFSSQLFVRPPQTAVLLFCISFPWGWSWSLPPVQCHEPHSIAHQALYLSDLSECKSRKSRNTWSNSQIWPWHMEWSRAKTNRVLPRKCTGHSKHPLPTTQEKTLHMDITRWSTPNSDWLYSLQPKMQKLYTVSKNKTGSWLWLRSWTAYCQIQT